MDNKLHACSISMNLKCNRVSHDEGVVVCIDIILHEVYLKNKKQFNKN